jgi:hypothetical protein
MKPSDSRAVSSGVWRRLCTSLALLFAGIPSASWAQDYSVKNGETIDLYPVYWVGNCQSRLLKFEGIDLLEGPPGIVLKLREQKVFAVRQNCPNPIPGAIVTLTVQNVASKFSGTVAFRVRYFTEDGSKQSSHKIKLDIY